MVISGAAGVGKTRLAREVLARAAAAGDRTNWIVGTESARQLPLGAFTASISGAMPELLPDVGRLVSSLSRNSAVGERCSASMTRTYSTGCPHTLCTSWRRPAVCVWW